MCLLFAVSSNVNIIETAYKNTQNQNNSYK